MEHCGVSRNETQLAATSTLVYHINGAGCVQPFTPLIAQASKLFATRKSGGGLNFLLVNGGVCVRDVSLPCKDICEK